MYCGWAEFWIHWHFSTDQTELEMAEQLGAGGYGEVYRAMWKGTEVAVKMMTSEVITKEMQRNFVEEVRQLTDWHAWLIVYQNQQI